MKLHDIIYEKDCYVYSTSYRFCFPFSFAPSTTVAPMNLDFSKAVNILWNRKDRNLLPLVLHHKLCEVARNYGLDRLYSLAVLAFAYPGGRPQEGLQILAQGARQAGDYFPFSADVMACMRSFVPSKWPTRNQLEEVRAVWSRGVVKAQEAKETRQERTVTVGDYCRFKPRMTNATMWRMWEQGSIDLSAGDIVKVVTTPENGMCYVNKPGKCPVLATMELVDPEWLELINGKFKECEYCGAIEHETSACPYRGKVPYGRKGEFSWRVEDGKMIFE